MPWEDPIEVGFTLSAGAVLPVPAGGSVWGYDLVASEDTVIEPGMSVVVPTGLSMVLPPKYEATVRPRLDIIENTKLRVQFSTLGSGPIGVRVDNWSPVDSTDCYYAFEIDDKTIVDIESPVLGTRSYIIKRGEKIAQLVISPIPDVTIVQL